ncbi:hypothetical protein ACFL5B_01320 [Candidatus Latescibacterota bacterium]
MNIPNVQNGVNPMQENPNNAGNMNADINATQANQTTPDENRETVNRPQREDMYTPTANVENQGNEAPAPAAGENMVNEELTATAELTAPAEETPAAAENTEPEAENEGPQSRENVTQAEQIQLQALRNAAQNEPGRNRFDVVV